MSDTGTNNTTETPDLASVQIAIIGLGVMAEAILAGLLRKQLVPASQICGSHPRAARREEIEGRYGIRMFASNAEASEYRYSTNAASIVVLAVKPQRLNGVSAELKDRIANDALVISI